MSMTSRNPVELSAKAKLKRFEFGYERKWRFFGWYMVSLSSKSVDGKMHLTGQEHPSGQEKFDWTINGNMIIIRLTKNLVYLRVHKLTEFGLTFRDVTIADAFASVLKQEIDGECFRAGFQSVTPIINAILPYGSSYPGSNEAAKEPSFDDRPPPLPPKKLGADKRQPNQATPVELSINKSPVNTVCAGASPSGVTIRVVLGNICDQKVCGIAASIANNCDLKIGLVARAILRNAGPQIQAELSTIRQATGPLSVGRIFTTKGYRLAASYVFHGFLSSWTGNQESKQNLETFITNVLKEAEYRKLISVAFPAIGTGKLAYPVDVVAECFVAGIINYRSNVSSTTIREVLIVVPHTIEDLSNVLKLKLRTLTCNTPSVLKYIALEDDLVVREFPPSWSPENPSVPCRKINLASSDREYQNVLQRITSTSKNTVSRIIKIERIENHELFRLYHFKLKRMEQTSELWINIERVLWHGTAKNSIDNILARGLNRSYCGKNATSYGNGVYFAREFSYSASDTYSTPDAATGVKHVFQCRVLTGYYTQGSNGMKEAPFRYGQVPYDSVVDNTDNPSMFIVFSDGQAYPEYLITFKSNSGISN